MGLLKISDVKITDMKMTGHENAGHEIEGHKSTPTRKMSKIIASVWYEHPNTFFLNCSISLAFFLNK